MTSWRSEEKHVSKMGGIHWLVVSGGYPQRADAEIALARLNGRGRAGERRVVELADAAE